METIPWRFTDKEVIAFSGQDRVPVLVDAGKALCGLVDDRELPGTELPGRPFALWRTGRSGINAFR